MSLVGDPDPAVVAGLRIGLEAVFSDGRRLGPVVEVERDAAGHPAGIVIARDDLLTATGTRLPLTDIAAVQDGEVRLRVSHSAITPPFPFPARFEVPLGTGQIARLARLFARWEEEDHGRP